MTFARQTVMRHMRKWVADANVSVKNYGHHYESRQWLGARDQELIYNFHTPSYISSYSTWIAMTVRGMMAKHVTKSVPASAKK